MKSDREFIVGIFGGSVSVFFCLAGVDRLVADLQQHDFFKDRKIVPLCMAHRGLQTTAAAARPHLLSSQSARPSIWSSTSMASTRWRFLPLNNQQGVDWSMPSVSHLLPLINLIDQATLTPEKLQSLAAISPANKQRLNWLSGTLQRNRLASVGVLLGRYRAIVAGRYERGVTPFRNPAVRPVRPFAHQRDSANGAAAGSHAPRRHRAKLGAGIAADARRCWQRARRLMCMFSNPTGPARPGRSLRKKPGQL